MIRFVVDGEPVAKARPRVVSGVTTYTPQRTRDAEEAVGWAFREAMPGHEPIAGWVGMRCTFYIATQRPRSDTDNFLKLVSDALNGIAYLDDRQIDVMHGRRVRGAANPRTVIEIWPVEPTEEPAHA